MSLTVAEALRDGARRLAVAGIDGPRLESRLLLAHVLGLTPESLVASLDAPVAPAAQYAQDGLLARRAAREPLAYILGWREFWSLRFRVSPATLIPRPDSETLVEAALTLFTDRERPLRVLDLGTGTGCLLLSFLHERPNAGGVGVDRSEAAARLARCNARDLGLASRAAFLCGYWAEALGTDANGPNALGTGETETATGTRRYDLVLGNPPYVATADLDALMPDVARFEPALALDGGPSGLNAYRAILVDLPRLLREKGVAVLELGAGQAAAVAGLVGEAGFQAETRDDLGGIARAIILRPSR